MDTEGRAVSDDLQACAAKAADRFDLWRRIVQSRDVRRMAEVGVWQGQFASHILGLCPGITAYYMIDPWRPLASWNKPLNVSVERFAEAHRLAIESTAFAASKVEVLRGTTSEVASRLPDGSLDLVYVDGDHTLRGIVIDLVRMLPKVRPGGILCGDDYHEDPWHHGFAYEPTLVRPFAQHFAEAMDLPFVAMPFRQFMIINQRTGYSFTNHSVGPRRDGVGRPAGYLSRAVHAVAARLQSLLHRRRP